MSDKSTFVEPARILTSQRSEAFDPQWLLYAVMLLILAGVAATLVALLYPRLKRQNWIVMDGSNVLYWEDKAPELAAVRRVVLQLQARGLQPVVWFDANVGYLVANRYLGPRVLARALGVSQRQVIVAEKGTPADPLVLEGARALRARIVTNDRFRDWAEDFPEVADAALFVRGTMRGGVAEM